MSEIVQDLHRPDINGTPPKMLAISELVRKQTAGILPYLTIECNDNIMSSVCLRGSLQAKQDWANGIWHNSPGFILFIRAKGNSWAGSKRYYEEGDTLEAEVTTSSSKLPIKFRKYSGTPEKVVAKVRHWLESLAASEVTG